MRHSLRGRDGPCTIWRAVPKGWRQCRARPVDGVAVKRRSCACPPELLQLLELLELLFYRCIALSSCVGHFETCDGVGNSDTSQPPPRASIRDTAPVICRTCAVMTDCWSVSRVVWAVTTSTYGSMPV